MCIVDLGYQVYRSIPSTDTILVNDICHKFATLHFDMNSTEDSGDEGNEASGDCLHGPNINDDENSHEDTDESTDRSSTDDVCSCDGDKFQFIHSHTIPKEYIKHYNQLVKTSFALYDEAFFKKQQKRIHEWSLQLPMLESTYLMYFQETNNVKRLFYLLDKHDVGYKNCSKHLAYLDDHEHFDKKSKDVLFAIYNSDWTGTCISRSRARFKSIVLNKHRAWLETQAGTVYKYQKAVVYWENELGLKWVDDFDRDHVSLASEHVSDDWPLAEFLIAMKGEDTVRCHWRQFIKWLCQEQDIWCINQLKERINEDEADVFNSAVMAGYLDTENLNDFKIALNNYQYDEDL